MYSPWRCAFITCENNVLLIQFLTAEHHCLHLCVHVCVSFSLLKVPCYSEIMQILFVCLPISLVVSSYIRMSVTASLLINIIGSRLHQILSRHEVDMLKNAHAIFRTCLQWWECRIFLNIEMKQLAYFHSAIFFPFPFYSFPHTMCLPKLQSRAEKRQDLNNQPSFLLCTFSS